MTKQQLLRTHIIAPALKFNNSHKSIPITGAIGQTHNDLITQHSLHDDEVERGFIDKDGQFKSRDQMRDHLNSMEPDQPFGDGEPTSEQLRISIPIYESPNQQIFDIGDGNGVSLVRKGDNKFDAAVLAFHHPSNPTRGFSINYNLLKPQDNLDEGQTQLYLQQAATLISQKAPDDGIKKL